MSDEQLRELERRFRASGSVEDEAAWLRARVHAGQLSQERLELGLRLRVTDDTLTWTRAPVVLEEVIQPIEELAGGDPELAQRACVALVGGSGQWGPSSVRTSYVLEEALVSTDDAAIQSAAIELAQRLLDVMRARRNEQAQRTLLRSEVAGNGRHEIAIQALRCLGLRGTDPGASLAAGRRALKRARGWTGLDPRWPESVQGMVASLRNDLVPWLLGLSDPVWERVEARRREAAGE